VIRDEVWRSCTGASPQQTQLSSTADLMQHAGSNYCGGSQMTQQGRTEEIEKAAHGHDVNVSQIVRYYKESVRNEPLVCLIQDINQRVGIYKNLVEELKRLSDDTDYDQQAIKLKSRYEKLGLIPTSNLPNPTAANIVRYALDKIAAYGKALLEIMARFSSDIRRELRIEPSLTLLFQVEVGWSPQLTIGVEAGAELSVRSSERG
jgi:hypothetical protein